jgi:hypothetical protein
MRRAFLDEQHPPRQLCGEFEISLDEQDREPVALVALS